MSNNQILKQLCQRLVDNQFDTIQDAEQALEQLEQLTTPAAVLELFNEIQRQEAFAAFHRGSAKTWKECFEAVKVEREKLRAFAGEMVNASFEGGSFEGGDIQDIAVKHGLVRIEQRDDECGEVCACRGFGFPAECYRKTDLLSGGVPQ